jgi:hypothetical protein
MRPIFLAKRQRLALIPLMATVAVALVTGPGTSRASTLDLGCPSPAPGPGGQELRIKVTKWCGLAAPHAQWQIKVQVKLTNTGRKPLDIRASHIWLAMSHFDKKKWTPPATVDNARPFKSTYEGRHVWLVPANADGAAEAYPPPQGNFTFATHWNAPASLAPRKTFTPGFHRGDLVFYVPRSKHQSVTHHLPGVVGIAYVDGPTIVVICPQERWGPKKSAASF